MQLMTLDEVDTTTYQFMAWTFHRFIHQNEKSLSVNCLFNKAFVNHYYCF